MTRHRKILLSLAVATGVLGLGAGAWAYAASCSNSAAYGLYAGSYMDTMLNPPKAEDVEFFTQSGGVPNIMILIDNSGSMLRMAPNGPSTLGTPPPAGVVGCGLDATTSAASISGTGTTFAAVNARTWSSPCGSSLTATTLASAYDSTKDYAHEASACPHYVNPNPVTGADGYDPDWYCGSGASATAATLKCPGNAPNFFDKNIVVHDLGASGNAGYSSSNMTGNGWDSTVVEPHLRGGRPATVAEFCADIKARSDVPDTQDGIDTATICAQCLNTRGWFFDGRVSANVNLGDITGQTVPSLWYTGNYLNFHPPKFLVARKVLKDTIMQFSKVRAAVATFNSSASGASVIQQFNPTCDQPESNFDSNRVTYMAAMNNASFDGNTGTPLSKALLDVGMYYHSTDLPWFGTPWSGRTPWANGQAPGAQAGAYTICYSCQVSSIILVTDGFPNASNDACSGSTAPLPVGTSTKAQATSGVYAGDTSTGIVPQCGTTTGGVSKTDCPECWLFPLADDYKNNLSRVAWYLHNFDLRKNSEATKDCQFNGGRQTTDFYAIGFNNSFSPDSDKILSNASKVGGGIYVPASNADEVRAGLTQILETINTRSTSFSVATLSTLQSQAGHSVIVPRFDPAKAPFWSGHLFRFELYSEFVNNCTPGGVGDLDCDGTCGGVFLQDKLGNFIQEDGTGSFKVNEPNKPSCSESKCGAGNCGLPGGADATPWWDAGKVLAEDMTWRQRHVYTAIDVDGDGRIDGADYPSSSSFGTSDPLRLEPTTAVAEKLVPYMNLVGTNVCQALSVDIAAAGDTETAAAILADATLVACAKEIIRFVLGADSFNSMGRTGSDYPPRATTLGSVDRDLLKDRAWKLGDIFHSSPVVVDPPLPSDGVLCARGLSRQCIPSLWATPVLNDATVGNAYDGYAKSTDYKTRRKVILVGANDGMVHAVNGGKWLPGQDDPNTTGLDESKPPFDGYFERENSGDELWAFVPPDQLAKLHLLAGTTHNIFVDGTPMVRDVWVDGTGNGLHSATTADDKKQRWEFHTVLVMNERRGGVHHFALDITDAFRKPSESGFTPPRFLWIYPQPNEPALLYSGEGYSDFLPTPPPIGPVRVKADSATGLPVPNVTPTTTTAAGTTVAYHERWVAFLSGGFDPQYLRGRGVHMVDVWTGKEMFDFSFPRSATGIGATDPRWALRFPVPATVAMLQWGKAEKNTASFANDGYFDTATFGDAGGQVWVLRFNDPGILDASTNLATNWFGARVFQMGGKGNPLLCTQEPFFYIAANVALPTDGTLRFLAGTGDRYNLLDQFGGTCGPDNLRACVQRGCTVTLAQASNRTRAADLGDRQTGLAATACAAPTFTDSYGTSTTCTIAGLGKVVISCGTGGSAKTTTKDVQYNCTGTGTGYGCSPVGSPAFGSTIALNDSSNVLTQNNKFFSLRVFEPTGDRRLFATAAAAVKYDDARLTDTGTDLVRIDGAATTFTSLSGIADNGWVMEFNHTPSVTIDNAVYTVTRPDERVSSTSAVAANCVLWNTTQTTSAVAAGGNGGCFVSNCKQLNRRIHYVYGADVTTGGLCILTPDALPVRSTAAVALVPPPAPQYTIFINQKGQVQVGLTSVNTEIGAKNVSAGGVIDPANTLEFLDVPRRLHDCRHSPAGLASPDCK